VGSDELAAVGAVFETGWLGLGATTYAFEQAIASRFGGRDVVAVNTGTAALHLALASLDLRPGDEVILPSITFAASVQTVLAAGGVPVFCESCESNLLIDVDDVERRLTPRTRAIMPVHYCGQGCDMDRLIEIGRARNLAIVEDAAHAFGSTYRGRAVGSFGDLTCFSFDPIKNITCGEGGAIVTGDVTRAEAMRRMRLLGIDKDTWHRYRNTRSWAYEVTGPGFRYHMPNFCAAVGLSQLPKLDRFIARRRAICRAYDTRFSRLTSVWPLAVDYDEAAPHIYIVRVPRGRRDAFMDFLGGRGVGTGIHYIANHTHPYFAPFVRGPLPAADRLWQEIVTVPLHAGMSDEEVATVIDAVEEFEKSGTAG
jgi:dTDP-4-amino-4,6-dideoxygalactose transaminase